MKLKRNINISKLMAKAVIVVARYVMTTIEVIGVVIAAIGALIALAAQLGRDILGDLKEKIGDSYEQRS